MEKELKNLVKQLRQKATIEYKKVTGVNSVYEGMCNGLYLAYKETANNLEDILKKYEKENT